MVNAPTEKRLNKYKSGKLPGSAATAVLQKQGHSFV